MANEKRLIDAVRLREALDRYANAPHVTMQYSQLSKVMRMAIDTCIELLDMQRTVDAVEVVRCKDCKNYIYSSFAMGMRCKHDGVEWGKDDFCSHGERKDNA